MIGFSSSPLACGYRVTAQDAEREISVAVKGSRKGYKTVTKVSAKVTVPA
ncbi:MAG: hypothetical protein KIT69_04640 [Propionibacteriaceae bacterium]|nr:hypothetical protein [Propionibacteriaceae bacterium]